MNSITGDNYTFTTAEKFFEASGSFNVPTSIMYKKEDNVVGHPPTKTGAIFRFNDGTLLLLQFVRPKLWKICFNPTVIGADEYNDFNSRTIARDTLTDLRDSLDEFEGIRWSTSVEESEDGKYYCLQSTIFSDREDKEGKPGVSLFVQKSPFRIIAVRPLLPMEGHPQNIVPKIKTSEISMTIPETSCIIWQTTPNGLAWCKKGNTTSTILSVTKPGASRYIGFGEQGGMSLFKYSTYMNYFDYDNMMYKGVYGKGAGDVREPLYHSEPFWIEVDTHQNLNSKVATFIDNYSQISIDFGKQNNGEIRVGTKYGSLQYFVMAGDNFPDIIKLYTSMVGRSRLKPRYILGHHQGCYGYDSQEKVIEKVKEYREHGIPLDGMHIDIDLQDQYRTFTINKERFPDPKRMFGDIRAMGVKACTNITPVISCLGTGYRTHDEGIEKKYFIMDERYTDDGIGKNPWDAIYISYENGERKEIRPCSDTHSKSGFYDNYNFQEVYNSKTKPYYGGVCYGRNLGTPGNYPDLNREEVRKWWGEQYRYLFEQGLEFVWQDMTTPCVAPAYGDMKGFPSRLMVSTDVYDKQIGKYPAKKPAIEIWSLYSYNLHKATYKGLNRMDLRKGKRNFVIGRAGRHRYAGLWTGDNASTWNFLRISVAQVLACGLSGGAITGADVGGFMPQGNENWADPELMIRWYCAYSLLPWFRNHYHGKPGKKYFQEPYIFTQHFNNPEWTDRLKDDKTMYLSVEPVCKYYVELRYTLLQLLYDAMFENQITGMPIARALVLTDILDDSLFKDTADFLYREYMVRNDLLVCPRLFEERNRRMHKVYLPQPDSWYKLNLRPDHKEKPEHDHLKISKSVALENKYPGGSLLEWDDQIRLGDNEHIPYITPMFVREGAIIPQIELRQFIPDLENRKANPITLNIYPGKPNIYEMYLDDGVSRESAPVGLPQYKNAGEIHDDRDDNGDDDGEARSVYRKVEIKQTCSEDAAKNIYTRIVTIRTLHDGYPLENLKRDIGDEYIVVMWHEPNVRTPKATVAGCKGQVEMDRNLHATVIKVPVEPGTETGTKIVCEYSIE